MSLELDPHTFKSNLSVSRFDDVLTVNLGGDDHEKNTPFNVMDDLSLALDHLEQDPSVRVLVLSFADGGYDFGTDVLDLSNLLPSEAERFSTLATRVYRRIKALELPTLCAIKGDCFGLGFEIALQCDLRVTCAGARFGLTGMNFGLAPNGQAIRSLCSLVGEAHARMMALTGAMISADRGFVMGFVTNVLDEGDFDSGVNVLASHLARMSRIAVTETKKILDAASASTSSGRDTSAQALARCLDGDGEGGSTFNFDIDPDNVTIH